MKKLLVASALISTCAIAETPLKAGGEFKLRQKAYEYNIDEKGRTQRDQLEMRARMNLNYKVRNNLEVTFSPQLSKTAGEAGVNGTGPTTNHSAFEVYEAYVQGNKDGHTYKFGRQSLSYGDGVLVGAVNWNFHAQSFDALKVIKEIKPNATLDLTHAKIVDGVQKDKSTDDQNLTVLYYSQKEKTQEKDAYIMYKHNPKGVSNLANFGVRGKDVYGKVTVTGEAIAQTQKESHTATSFNLKGSGNIDKDLDGFASASVNSDRFDQLYTFTHGYFGQLDYVGRRNLSAFSIGAIKALKVGKLKVELFDFYKTNKKEESSDKARGNLNLSKEKNHLGRELDFTYNYAFNNEEDIELGYSYFMPGASFKSKNPHQFIYAMYGVKF